MAALDADKVLEILRDVKREQGEWVSDDVYVALNRVESLIREANRPLVEHAGDVVRDAVKIQKITMIKELRTRTGCDLKDGKMAIENALELHLQTELTEVRRVINGRANNYHPSFGHPIA